MALFAKVFGKREETPARSTEEVKAALRRALGESAAPPPELPEPAGARPLSTVLRPALPLPPAVPTESWLGGLPRAPDPFAWPLGDDGPLRFLCQLDCSVLPPRLWRGAGPRTGWLLVFAGTRNGVLSATLLHTDTLGPPRTPPDAAAASEPAWPAEVITGAARPDTAEATGAEDAPPTSIGALDHAPHQPRDGADLQLLIGLLRQEAEASRDAAAEASRAVLHPAAPYEAARRAMLSAAGEMRARFDAFDRTRPWSPALWTPFARVVSEWRKLLLTEKMKGQEPLAHWAARLTHFAEALIRGAARENRDEGETYEKLLAAREPCLALGRAIAADPRLPPVTARGADYEAERRFRDAQPELYAMYADELRGLYAMLSDLRASLGVRGRVDDPSGANGMFPDDGPPESWEEAATRLARYEEGAAWLVQEAGSAARAAAAAAAAGAEVRAAERRVQDLTALAAAIAGSPDAAWPAWRDRVLALLPEDPAAIPDILASYTVLRSDRLLRAYLRDPATLPAETAPYFLDRWRRQAARESVELDSPAARGTLELPAAADDRVVLLRLPTSRFLGWDWGEEADLTISLPRDALRRGELGAADVSLSAEPGPGLDAARQVALEGA